MSFDLFPHSNSAFVLVGLPETVACGVFSAQPLLNTFHANFTRIHSQARSTEILDPIKNATCVAKFIQYVFSVIAHSSGN